jgi:hypothetical protein
MDAQPHIYVSEYAALHTLNEQRGRELVDELCALYKEQYQLPELLRGSVILRPHIMQRYMELNNRAYAILSADLELNFRAELIRLCNFYFEVIVMKMQ